MRLENSPQAAGKRHRFRVYRGGGEVAQDWNDVMRIAKEEELAHDLKKLGVRPS
jgi:hypothetical protein